MKLAEMLRKGFGYMLLTFGVSQPAPKPRLSRSEPENQRPSRI